MKITERPLFEQISNRMFHFSLMDLRQLRAKYRNARIDVPHYMINKATREYLVKQLASEEFGEESVQVYLKQCKEWDKLRALLEYGVDADA